MLQNWQVISYKYEGQSVDVGDSITPGKLALALALACPDARSDNLCELLVTNIPLHHHCFTNLLYLLQ